eukprot:UN19173
MSDISTVSRSSLFMEPIENLKEDFERRASRLLRLETTGNNPTYDRQFSESSAEDVGKDRMRPTENFFASKDTPFGCMWNDD